MTRLLQSCENCSRDVRSRHALDDVGFVTSLYCAPCGFLSVSFSDLRRSNGVTEVSSRDITSTGLGAATGNVVVSFPGS